MTKLISIDDFIDRLLALRERLSQFNSTRASSPLTKNWPNGFPHPEAIREALKSAYFASLERYEGRMVKTILFWSTLSHVQGNVCRFSKPLPLDRSAIRQLAQVATPAINFISLQIARESLMIEGIMPGGRESECRFKEGIAIAIRGPGHLEYVEGSLSMAYVRGEKRRLRFIEENQLWKAFILGAEARIAERVSKLPNLRPIGKCSIPYAAIGQYFFDILRAIEVRSHGGTVVVLPNAQSADNVNIRFAGDSDTLDHLLYQLIAVDKKYLATQHFHTCFDDPQYYLRRIRSFGYSVGQLSQCDGTIVFLDDLTLLGFGGIIQPPNNENKIPPKLSSKGARHNSAYWLCSRVPGAIAFVVSSDGGLTLFHNDENRVSIHSNLLI